MSDGQWTVPSENRRQKTVVRSQHRPCPESRIPADALVEEEVGLSRAEVSLQYHIMRTGLVTTLKRRATRILADLHESKDPVLITERGVPSAYQVDVAAFELMQERMAILEGIARGERAILEGRTMTHAEARGRMRKWLA